MNIHGHCKIALTDVNTGKVETQEHDNLVTKALEYFYKQGGITNPTAFNATMRSQALKYLLGGIFCLDTAMTEQNTVVRVPSTHGMTANGAVDVVNTGNPTELGSFNETESGWQQDGSYKMVFDWTTSQGNGDIKSVCLTSAYYGMAGLGNKSLTSKANSYNNSAYNTVTEKTAQQDGSIIAYDANKVYIMDNDFTNKTKVNVYVYKLPVAEIDIRNTMAAELVETIEVALPNEMQNLTSSGTGWSISNTFFKDGIGYGLVNETIRYSNLRNSNAFVIKFNLSTKTLTSIHIDKSATLGQIRCFGVTDKYVVLGLVAIEFDNPANEIDIDDDAEIYGGFGVSYGGYLYALDTDRLYGDTNSGNAIINIEQEAMLPINGSCNLQVNTHLATNPLLGIYKGYDTVAVARDYRYVGTIFNLESPVTKTADKTMKVTYVLRFS